MSTSTVAVTTSGVAAALVLVGLTLGLAGDAADQSAHAQPPEIAASASIDSSAAASAEAGHVPVLLAPAEKQKGESDANEVGTAGTTDDPAESEAILRAKYGATDMKSRPRAEQSILDALETPTELAFIDTPLQDVIDTLKDFHKIEIQIDQRALDEVGIPSDTPITKSLKGVSLRSALRLMLRELDLTYVIVDEVMLITTPEVADAMMETHVYSLHLLDELDSDELARVIQNTIRPDTWRTGELSDETSSSSTAKASKGPPLAAIEALPGCLVITQSQHAHEEIAELLEQLERYQTGTRMLQQAPGD